MENVAIHVQNSSQNNVEHDLNYCGIMFHTKKNVPKTINFECESQYYVNAASFFMAFPLAII